MEYLHHCEQMSAGTTFLSFEMKRKWHQIISVMSSQLKLCVTERKTVSFRRGKRENITPEMNVI